MRKSRCALHMALVKPVSSLCNSYFCVLNKLMVVSVSLLSNCTIVGLSGRWKGRCITWGAGGYNIGMFLTDMPPTARDATARPHTAAQDAKLLLTVWIALACLRDLFHSVFRCAVLGCWNRSVTGRESAVRRCPPQYSTISSVRSRMHNCFFPPNRASAGRTY